MKNFKNALGRLTLDRSGVNGSGGRTWVTGRARRGAILDGRPV